MAQHSEFVEFVLEQLAPLGGVRARAMFGGHGIYWGETFFALVVGDRLYFKADQATRQEFIARGLKPFSYAARGKIISLQYYEAPPEVFEEQEAMRSWGQQAVEVALASNTDKKPSTRLARRRR